MKKIPIINQIIKNKRKELKITQEDFTKIINKAISTVRRYDTGDIISENTLILICSALDLNIIDLVSAQEEENKHDNTNYYGELIEKYIKTAKRLNFGYGRATNGTIYQGTKPIFINGISVNELLKMVENKKTNGNNENKEEKQIIENNNNNNIKSFYDIEVLKIELLNYLNFKDDFLKLGTTEEEKKNKIEKILSFIDFLYFQDIIKK